MKIGALLSLEIFVAIQFHTILQLIFIEIQQMNLYVI